MKIHMWVQREVSSSETIHWIADAVDEWAVDSTGGAALADIERDHDDSEGRWLIVEVPDDAMERAFAVPTVKGTVVE